MKIFAVIPAHNESRHISRVVKETKKYVDEVIVVDDGSRDDTFELAEKSKATALKHIVNLGKGASLKTGCDYAVQNNADLMVVIDGDGQHDPREIPNFVKALKTHDVVLAYRQRSRKMPAVLRFGNNFINETIKFLYGVKIRDSQCGYRAFTKKAYRKLRWRAADYSMESEMIAKIGKHNLTYVELPIETIYSDKYKGTTVIDGVKIVINLFLWKLRI